MVEGYVAGANRWLRDNKVTDPACRGAAYLDAKGGLGKVTALDLWYGVYLANLLASSGVFVKEIVDATPPSLTDPGLPTSLPVSAADLTRSRRTRSSSDWAATPRARSAPTRQPSAVTGRLPAAACCWATRTSRGVAATASPSST